MQKAYAKEGSIYAKTKSITIEIDTVQHNEWYYLGFVNGMHEYSANGIVIRINDQVKKEMFG